MGTTTSNTWDTPPDPNVVQGDANAIQAGRRLPPQVQPNYRPPMHTVLHHRVTHPEQRSAETAIELSGRLGKELTANWVRKWLHAARERFAELLLAEVVASLRDPSPDAVVQELIDLELLAYCKDAVDRWREHQEGE